MQNRDSNHDGVTSSKSKKWSPINVTRAHNVVGLNYCMEKKYKNGGRRVSDHGRKVGGSVVCVKSFEEMKKVEEVEDCFILEFDPNEFDNGGRRRRDHCRRTSGGSVVSVKSWQELRKVEEVEDCFIIEFDPTESLEFSKLSLKVKSEFPADDDDEVSILAEKGKVACRDYPHPRHLCANHPFKETPHVIHCKMCYCYVCDLPAPCKEWTEGYGNPYMKHCNATDHIPYWKSRRELKKKWNESKMQ